MDKEIQQMASQYPRVADNTRPIIVRASNDDNPKPYDYNASSSKWKVALTAAVLFFVLSLPWTYKLANKIAGEKVEMVSAEGCPSIAGAAIFAAIFLIVFRLVM